MQQEQKTAQSLSELKNTLNIEQIIDPLKDGISSIALVRVSGSDVDVANAARVSYGKFVTQISDRDAQLIRFLLEHNHTSPFEHNQFSFRIKAPLFVARQWMRHRMNSYNEISYRYVKAPMEFYIPPKFRWQDTVNRQASVGSYEDKTTTELYKQVIEASVQTYEKLLESGVCRELARGVLPMCTYTQFIFTCNLHSLMHFLRLRLHAGAQYEIQMFARALLQLTQPHFPVSLAIWRELYLKEDQHFDQFTPGFTKTAE